MKTYYSKQSQFICILSENGEISDIIIFYKVALCQIEEDKLLSLFPLNNKVINAFAILLIIAMILTILSEREIRKLT